MNIKATLLATAALALGVSAAAVAAPPGKPDRTGPDCRPRISVILRGELLSADAAAGSLSMRVTRANRHGRRFVGEAAVTVNVAQQTRIRRRGHATLADLVAGDRLVVQARMCKADAGGEAAPELVAKRIVAHPARTPAPAPAPEEGGGATPPAPPAP